MPRFILLQICDRLINSNNTNRRPNSMGLKIILLMTLIFANLTILMSYAQNIPLNPPSGDKSKYPMDSSPLKLEAFKGASFGTGLEPMASKSMQESGGKVNEQVQMKSKQGGRQGQGQGQGSDPIDTIGGVIDGGGPGNGGGRGRSAPSAFNNRNNNNNQQQQRNNRRNSNNRNNRRRKMKNERNGGNGGSND